MRRILSIISILVMTISSAVLAHAAQTSNFEIITANNAARLAPFTSVISPDPNESLEVPLWSPDGHVLAVTDVNNIFLFDTSDFSHPAHKISELTRYIEFSSNSKWLASLTGKNVNVYDVSTGQKKYTFEGGDFGAHFSPNSKMLGIVDHGKVFILNADTGTGMFLIPAYQSAFVFSPDSSALATMNEDTEASIGSIWIWDLKTGKRTASLRVDDKQPSPPSLTYSPDGKYIAVFYLDYGISFINVATGKEQYFLDAHFPDESHLISIDFSPQKNLLAAFGPGRTSLWNYASGKSLAVFDDLDLDLYGGVFNKDGSLLAYWDYDEHSGENRVMLWDIDNHKERLVLHDARDPVFSPDGTMLATWGDSIIIWTVH